MAEIVFQVDGFERVFAVLDKLENPQWDRLLEVVGETLEAQTKQHFQEQGGPEGAWPPTKRGGQILVKTGLLRGSIEHAAIGPLEIAVGTNVAYGKFHQFGTRKMPRRAFLGLTTDDKVEISNVIETYIRGLTQ